MTSYIGIDPGKTGAACIISGSEIEFIRFTDYKTVTEHLRIWSMTYDVDVVCIEKVGSMPGQGVKSMFSFGENFGFWQGIVNCLFKEPIFCRPQKWQKKLLDDGSDHIKIKSVRVCNTLTGLGLRLTKDGISNGKADAYHLARYARHFAEGI